MTAWASPHLAEIFLALWTYQSHSLGQSQTVPWQ